MTVSTTTKLALLLADDKSGKAQAPIDGTVTVVANTRRGSVAGSTTLSVKLGKADAVGPNGSIGMPASRLGEIVGVRIGSGKDAVTLKFGEVSAETRKSGKREVGEGAVTFAVKSASTVALKFGGEVWNVSPSLEFATDADPRGASGRLPNILTLGAARPVAGKSGATVKALAFD